MVWEETVRIALDLFDNVWGQKEEIIVDHAVEITLPVSPQSTKVYLEIFIAVQQIALFVIGVAGFGQRMPWTNEEVIPAGHQMGFKVS